MGDKMKKAIIWTAIAYVFLCFVALVAKLMDGQTFAMAAGPAVAGLIAKLGMVGVQKMKDQKLKGMVSHRGLPKEREQ